MKLVMTLFLILGVLLSGCAGTHIHNLKEDCEQENGPYFRCKDV